MGANYLVQLAAEWYEYQGYLVARNVAAAGADTKSTTELDVLAVHAGKAEIVHIEASMDSDAWQKRDKRFRAKFRAGQAHVAAISKKFKKKPVLRQRALLGCVRSAHRRSLGGGELMLMPGFLHEIFEALAERRIDRQIVPEHLPVLRTLHFVSAYREDLFARDQLF